MPKLQGYFYSKRPKKQDLQTNKCLQAHLASASSYFQVVQLPVQCGFNLTSLTAFMWSLPFTSVIEAQTFNLLSLVEAEEKLRKNLD